MRTVLSVSLSVVLLVAAESSAQTLRVASWNIENLGVRQPSNNEPTDDPQTAADLAQYIDNSEADLLALQEIHDTDGNDNTRTNETLEETLNLLNQNGAANWTVVLLPKKNSSAKDQLLAVAWNRNEVEQIGQRLAIEVPDRVEHPDAPSNGFNVWDRGLHALKFKAVNGGTDFVLIPVHMKSNVGGSGPTSQQRGIEAEILIDSLPEIREHFGDLDVFVAGDTNILADQEPAIQNFTAAGFTDLNEEQQTFVTGAEFDRLLVPDRAPFAQSQLTVFASGLSEGDNGEHEQRLSDHILIFMDVAIAGQDDPEEEEVEEVVTLPEIHILAVLPDPVGIDEGRETITLGNATDQDVSVEGWQLMDRSGNDFQLDGNIPANGTRSFTAPDSFPLNNNGDEIRVIAPDGRVIDEVEYGEDDVERGEFITFDQ